MDFKKYFKKMGEYREPNKAPIYENWIGRRKSKGPPLVYLLVVDDVVKYIGETRRGYSRPLNYHKNLTMINQHKGIIEETSKGKVVEIWFCEVKDRLVSFNKLKFSAYIAQDYEKALIREHNPEWNGRK
jgi:hypothetical protein